MMRKNSFQNNSPEGRIRPVSPRRMMYNLSKQRQVLEQMYKDKFEETIFMKTKMGLLEKSLIAAKELNRKYQAEIDMQKAKLASSHQQIQKLCYQMDQIKKGNQMLAKNIQQKQMQYNNQIAQLSRQFNEAQLLRDDELKQIQLDFIRKQINLNQKIKLIQKQKQRTKPLKLGQFSSHRHFSQTIQSYRSMRIPDPSSEIALNQIQKLIRQVSQMEQSQLSIHFQKQDFLQKIQQRISRFCINYLNNRQISKLPLTSSVSSRRL